MIVSMKMDYKMDFGKPVWMNFFKYSNLARKSLKFYKIVVTLLNFFMKLLSSIKLEFLKSLFHKF